LLYLPGCRFGSRTLGPRTRKSVWLQRKPVIVVRIQRTLRQMTVGSATSSILPIFPYANTCSVTCTWRRSSTTCAERAKRTATRRVDLETPRSPRTVRCRQRIPHRLATTDSSSGIHRPLSNLCLPLASDQKMYNHVSWILYC